MAVIAACSAIPQDTDGTSDRVAQRGELRVAIVSGTPDTSEARLLAVSLAQSLGARVVWHAAPEAIAIKDLEEDRVDLVIGQFGRTAAVSKEASLSQAVGIPEPKDGKEPVIRLARKNGENALITRTDMMVMR